MVLPSEGSRDKVAGDPAELACTNGDAKLRGEAGAGQSRARLADASSAEG